MKVKLEILAKICKSENKRRLKLYIRNEKYRNAIWNVCIQFMATWNVKKFIIDIGKIDDLECRRDKVKALRAQLREGEIFYLVSKHNMSGKDHAEWQGKIYVNRYWRSLLENDRALCEKVSAYVKNRNIKTVQEIVHEPVYMITRPYCRHNIVTVPVDVVLNNGIKAVLREYNPKDKKIKPSRAYKNNIDKVKRALGN